MTATVTQVAWLISACALLVLACAALVLVILGRFSKASVDLRAMSASVEAVAAEVKPNGGSSIKDQLNRIETDLRDHKHRSSQAAAAIDARVTSIEELLTSPAARRLA